MSLVVLGCLCTVIGIIGIVLPGLPGTVFLIAATACFARSSPRFEAWLLGHRVFGPPIRKWRESGAIPRRAKMIACGSLAASFAVIAGTGAPAYVMLAVAPVFVAVAVFIVTRPEGSHGR